MVYSTIDDIALDMDEQELVQLTDDDESGVVDPDVVARAIADADRLIDAYLGARYRLPLQSAPDLARKISVDLSIFNLFSRRGVVPDIRKERHGLALQTLDKLAAGKIKLDVEEIQETTARGVRSTNSKNDRIITKRTMERL